MNNQLAFLGSRHPKLGLKRSQYTNKHKKIENASLIGKR